MSKLPGPYLLSDPERCTGCRSCEIACSIAHSTSGSLLGAVLSGEPLTPRLRVVQVAEVKFPTQCRQCEDAPCVRVCPTGATYRANTFTAVNEKVCIACKLCMMVCPFGAIQIASLPQNGGSRRAAVKCDLCNERAAGPACVESCPTGAIRIAHPQETMQTAQQSSAERYLLAIRSQASLSK